MMPLKSDNIYPLSSENISALLNHFFDIPFGDIQWLYDQRELSLNQMEFVAKEVSKHQDFLEENVGSGGSTVSNFMDYGIEAAFKHPNMWRGSQNRKRIIRELNKFIYQSKENG